LYLWRKIAGPPWLSAHKSILEACSRRGLAIISRPKRKQLQLEIACTSRSDSRKLVKEFGGCTEKLPRDWLKRFTDGQKRKPLKIGKRLVVVRAGSDGFPAPKTFGAGKPSVLVIPASAAFGTGDHATTAMSLRLLEQLTRAWKNGWSAADLGTGTGVLAFAAKRFGAQSVVGIDIDPTAISTAKANARLNRIDGVNFHLADVRKCNPAHATDVIAANLFSDLLIEILPNFKRSGWLILSGIVRPQEGQLIAALGRTKLNVVRVKRRGKWITILARGSVGL